MASGHPDDFKEWPGGKMVTSEKAMTLGIIGGGTAPSQSPERTAFVTPENHDQYWKENPQRTGFRDATNEGFTVIGTIE